MSTATIAPPALLIAAVTLPSMPPGSCGSSTRRVSENCALGVAIGDGRRIAGRLAVSAPSAALIRLAPWPPSRPRELFLIDGNSLVYRAFFALPESIATSKGQPTNAIFGFASMLVKMLTEYGAKPTIVVWDAGMSGRKEVYAEYKAGRRSRPDLLREQWPHCTRWSRRSAT